MKHILEDTIRDVLMEMGEGLLDDDGVDELVVNEIVKEIIERLDNVDRMDARETWAEHVELIRQKEINSTRQVLALFGIVHPEGIFDRESQAANALANTYWSFMQSYVAMQDKLNSKEGRLF